MPIRWLLDNPNDLIQNHLANGQWFEHEYLKVMQQYCNTDSIILDIGAHIGNHTMYFSKIVQAKSIYVIEPIYENYRLLLANIAYNYCYNVNVDYIGVALGDREAVGYPYLIYGENNTGAARISPRIEDNADNWKQYKQVKVIIGDSLFENIKVDFIKVDVEGMEIVALEGLKNTINRSRPNIFIEVAHENLDYYNNWLKEQNYKIVFEHNESESYASDDPFRTYNYMIVPKESNYA